MQQTTFNSDPRVKATVMRTLAEHEAMDSFVHGTYLSASDIFMLDRNRFGGCALGCTLLPWGVADRAPDISSALDNLDIDEELREKAQAAYGGAAPFTFARVVGEVYSLPLWLTRLEESVFESQVEDGMWHSVGSGLRPGPGG